jgi:hypothetical protein
MKSFVKETQIYKWLFELLSGGSLGSWTCNLNRAMMGLTQWQPQEKPARWAQFNIFLR